MRDVVVIGAGPGGSAAAHYMALLGLDVLLLDRADFPRDKTCGDGLTPRALRVLDDMGILADVSSHGRAISGYEVVAPNGKRTSATITGPHAALVVRRMLLDDIIRKRALDSGAKFERATATRVAANPRGVSVLTRQGREVEARLAIVATGAATSLLTQSGILKKQPRAMLAIRGYFEDVVPEALADRFELRFDSVPLPGYGWLFPVDDRTANVGVGFLPRRGAPPSQVALQRFLESPRVRQTLGSASQVGPVKGYPIRVDFLHSPTYADRTLLVGEAAGLVNPLTGEGIDYALESGRIAAEHAAAALENPGYSLAAYDAALRQRFGKIFRFSEHVRDWYCVPPLLNMLVPLANRRPELRQLLANIVLGEREPAGYGPLTMLARLLVYLVRTRPRPPHRSFAA